MTVAFGFWSLSFLSVGSSVASTCSGVGCFCFSAFFGKVFFTWFAFAFIFAFGSGIGALLGFAFNLAFPLGAAGTGRSVPSA